MRDTKRQMGNSETSRRSAESSEVTSLSMPFRIDRSVSTTLVDQVASGLRGAIRSGIYKPGDRLPAVREIARSLETSKVVVHQAIQKLAAEGQVMAHSRSGTRVLDADTRSWRAHVLWVRVPSGSYYFGAFDLACAEQLQAADIRVTSICGLPDSPQAIVDQVEAALDTMNITHVLFTLVIPGALERCVDRNLPVISYLPESTPKNIQRRMAASVLADGDPALCDMAEYLVGIGRPRCMVMGRDPVFLLGTRQILDGHHIPFSMPELDWPPFGIGIEHTEQAGCFTMHRVIENGELPELLIVLDDHMARGAYAALLEHGLRVPDDVQMITWANRGNRMLVLGKKAFTRIENDPIEHGCIMAKAVTDMLGDSSETVRRTYHMGPRFIVGDTTRPIDRSAEQ